MSVSYAVVYSFIVASMIMAFLFTVNLLANRPSTYMRDVQDLMSLVCYAAENPGYEFRGYIRIEGNILVRNGSLVLEEDFWAMPVCGRQQGTTIYLPILAEEEFVISGYQFCSVSGEDGYAVVKCGGG